MTQVIFDQKESLNAFIDYARSIDGKIYASDGKKLTIESSLEAAALMFGAIII
jgi:hypothetical protein